jgi:Uncharacterised nucleotidyltransferase
MPDRGHTLAEHELALLSVSADRRRAASGERIAALARAVDWRRLADVLARQRLLELAGARLGELAGVDPPADFAAVRGEATAATRRRAEVNRMTTLMVAEALERDGIRALPLKGPLLAEHLYRDPGLRPSEDIDVLVAVADLAPAGRSLGELGYVRAGDRGAPEPPTLHHTYVSPAGLPAVDLHWRIHWYEERFAPEMLAGAEPGPDGALRATPAHELTSLLVFYARDGFAGLRLAADIARFGDLHASDLPPRALSALATRHPALRRAIDVAALQAHRVAGAELGEAAAAGRRAPAAARLGDWALRSDDNQIRANTTLVDLLLGPRAPLAFVRRHVLPPAVVLHERGIVPPGAGAVGRGGAAILHAVRLLARYAIAAWRIRGGRDWSPLPRPW